MRLLNNQAFLKTFIHSDKKQKTGILKNCTLEELETLVEIAFNYKSDTKRIKVKELLNFFQSKKVLSEAKLRSYLQKHIPALNFILSSSLEQFYTEALCYCMDCPSSGEDIFD